MASTIITKNSSTASAVPVVGDLTKGELAVNVTDKKIYTKDNSAAVVKLVGSLGNQEANAVAITGGSIAGITDLAVADGGTGASTAAGALNNLLPSQTSNANKYLQTDGTNATWDAISISTSDITGTLPVLNGGTGTTTSTGSGNVVLSTSPTLVTPALGTPSSATLTNATGLPISTGVSGLGTGVATFLGTPSSANLISAVTDETGTGSLVFATSPTLVTPALGTPSALVGTNITGTASGLTAGNVTTNANLTGAVTSVGNASSLGSFTSAQLLGALTDETGTGSAVFATSPTLVTPILGTPTSATLTNATGLPISTGVSGLGTGVATALAVNVGSAGAPVVNGGALGTPSSGTVTNLTGTASININGTVGATTASTGAFTTLAASGAVTLSGGTANGVTYLNGSKVLTSGSGLVFDGTNLGIGTSSAGGQLDVYTSIYKRMLITYPSIYVTRMQLGSFGYIESDAGNDYYKINGGGASGANIRFDVYNSEQMRLTSTGLGIGTSSPAAPLNVQKTGAGSVTSILLSRTTENAADQQSILWKSNDLALDYAAIAGVIDSGTAGSMQFKTATGGTLATKATLDSAGNLGLGIAPSVWGSSFKAMQIGTAGCVWASNSATEVNIGGNTRVDANNAQYDYINTGAASQYQQVTGSHRWFNAPSGTAGNAISFTQAMTLDASGNLLLGQTSGGNRFSITSSGTALARFTGPEYAITAFVGGSQTCYIQNWNNISFFGTDGATPLALGTNGTERARIDSSGNFSVNNPSGSQYVQLQPDGSVRSVLASGSGGDSIFSAITGVSNGYQISVTTGNAQTYKWFNGGSQSMTLGSSGKLSLGDTGTPSNHMMKITSTTEAGILLTGVNSVGNDASITTEINNGTMLMVTENNTGDGALFFCCYASATITLISDPNNKYATSITAGKVCVTKSAASGTVTITNKVGSTRSITVGKFSTSD